MAESVEFNSLVDRVFNKDPLESADFEIAFTATLATAVLTSLGSGDLPMTVLKVLSVSLISITLVRRMAVSSRFIDESKLLSATMPLIELLTILTVFHLFYTLSATVNPLLPIPSNSFLVSIITIPEFLLTIVVLQEIFFKNFMVWWGWFGLHEAIGADGTVHRTLGGIIALVCFKFMLVEKLPTELDTADDVVNEFDEKLQERLDELGEIGLDISAEMAQRSMTAWVFFFSILGLGTVFFALSYVISLFIGTVMEIFLLLLAISILKTVVRFYYLGYGLPDENQVFYNKGRYTMILNVVYVGSIYLIFA